MAAVHSHTVLFAVLSADAFVGTNPSQIFNVGAFCDIPFPRSISSFSSFLASRGSFLFDMRVISRGLPKGRRARKKVE
ncbi:uncharacterized protein BDZ83DRAFT_604080 [Colletotrichum acutatum]|uniref:Secreted protein n=1 Tax=Glomerella acutata TaxID=27357 RepID=A0AAD9D1A2_GLOAC|nr:uncharacterized protein BDZ83DRAFT_604080 [Colletotrichum acutatum]KAK1729939.1 hypothetical protein BDZ83DRAFT_604080 [Colletotrichum acutatum]